VKVKRRRAGSGWCASPRTPSKYRAVPTQLDGIRFDSKKEARRYAELRLLEQAGEIHALERQPVFPLFTAHHRGGELRQVGVYRADFRYRQGPRGVLVVEDVKSKPTRTAVYRLKKRMVEAAYGITVTEV
jgi:Protein of unknown function (DUF1064)